MSALEWLMVIVLSIPAGIAGGWLGRQWQRHQWLLDRPYSERVEALKPKRR